MRKKFVHGTLSRLLSMGTVSVSDSVLSVCGSHKDREIFSALGFEDVTITNLRDSDEHQPYKWARQDAQNLRYEDGSFDFCFVSDGLHHCASPHRAAVEMYRVARKGIIVFESRDSMLMRTAVALGLTTSYEVAAVVNNDGKQGGVDNTEIPNYVYRWTESEFKKCLRSFDPTGNHEFRFFYSLNFPRRWQRPPLAMIASLANVVPLILPRQCNSFGMVALKPRSLFPWLVESDGRVRFNREMLPARAREPESVNAEGSQAARA